MSKGNSIISLHTLVCPLLAWLAVGVGCAPSGDQLRARFYSPNLSPPASTASPDSDSNSSEKSTDQGDKPTQARPDQSSNTAEPDSASSAPQAPPPKTPKLPSEPDIPVLKRAQNFPKSDLSARYLWNVYRVNNLKLPESSRSSPASLHQYCQKKDSFELNNPPTIGDIVFFHNVVDANADGRNNDWYAYAAVVTQVRDTGVIVLLGYFSGQVRRLYMSLDAPENLSRKGDLVNTRIRPKTSEDPPFTRYLTGQLYAGHCSLLGKKPKLKVIDNWQPGMKLSSVKN